MERALETITHLELGLKGGSDLSDELQMERAMIQLSARSGN
jgi:hypothetical protein